jgi:Trk K+ transport system NAD-binding subunit
LILLVRPLAVLLSVPPSELDGRQRIVLALTAPRGIVAAAVASLSAIQLRDVLGAVDDAAALEGLVYLTILITCAWATVMAPILPRILGYLHDPSRRRVVLVGAHPVSVAIARMLGDEQWTATIVDASRAKLDDARGHGVATTFGDARDTSTYEDAGTERDSYVLALTTNDELNMLIANLVRNEFGVEHPIIAFQSPHEEFGRLRGAWVDLLSGGPVSMHRWGRLLEDHQAELMTVVLPKDEALSEVRSLLRSQGSDYLLICGWNGHQPRFRIDLAHLDEIERLTVITSHGEARERLEAALARNVDEPAGADDADAVPGDAVLGDAGDDSREPRDQTATQRMPTLRRDAAKEQEDA